MSAKDATLERTGSHWISDDNYSSRADGISKEEVFLYFSAKWRGQPVQVTMQASRYSASFYDQKSDTSTNKLTEWRVYAQDARFYDPDKNGGRGDDTTRTARSALGKLCEPLAMAWLDSEEYTRSVETALAHFIMRKFQESYNAARYVSEALATFRDRLSPESFAAISETLDAFNTYETAKARAFETISAQGSN